ncbi:hypothetical protein [Paenibacillus medicaginis]|uniref:Uncharacterized protein n=1 Tax=Paenibacillus medicaginis TaxID=1470560 RepID=A0ABV5C9Q6_9BACL
MADNNYMYVQYYKETGNVVAITSAELAAAEGYAVAKTEKYKPGDEFTYTITVLAVSETGDIDSDFSVLNNPQAAQLLADNAALKAENTELKQAIADLTLTLAAVMAE